MTTEAQVDLPDATPPELVNRVVISVDAMGSDMGPASVVAGCALSARKNPDIGFILHGRKDELEPLVAKRGLGDRCVIHDAPDVVTMDTKPSAIMRRGGGTSMWSAIDSVRNGEATVAVSCGNTGALMALSMVRLRKLPGVSRPAIACLWPSQSETGYAVMLDVGADIRADEHDLLQYARMGASYARNGLGIQRPRVGLLNVGTEEHKGRPELKAAQALISEGEASGKYEFVGFIEGGDIPSGAVDVIVTDGFTGNIALKTAEGTASLIRDLLKQAFRHTFLSRMAAILALTSMRRLSKRIDPRRVNGGVFLGLNGTIVKSHGSADPTGVSAAIKLAFQLAQAGFSRRLADTVASTSPSRQDMP
ncbi:phosphate acyltransferase PlsX [Tropicimonas isoalkanivorans]|uniref:Phosphate acyltransferase n=1 Tax=Tropicimonas isoalkanivorans TaxID=441112 RepID=A0A1I1IFG9_9RHOB|nr:phosphate acyltransferase PlsX [Tropicimonas isoalkanivorans]SFC34402.1 phosphate:acyl-[acyl carrier protein] acyltransferase [Tropicimonas isoalkanivorans]